MGLPLIFGLLVVLTVLAGFVAVWRILSVQDPVDERLKGYSVAAELSAPETAGGQTERWPTLSKFLNGLALGPKLARMLTQAGIARSPAEFVLRVLGLGGALAVAGWWLGPKFLGLPAGLGLLFGVAAAPLALMYVRFRQGQRRKAFTAQLPRLLTMLVGALRVGYGLTQALDTIRAELPAPMSVELGRALRDINLGLPVPRALEEMADRSGNDDLELVVTAITVQHELGGNLAQTLEIIGDTIRDRIRIKQEIKVFTSQQSLTGIMLALLPVGLGIVLFVINPEYMRGLFEPGIGRMMLIAAIVMQIVGFVVMRKILAIEV
jgi:tight adherence protein B